MGSPHRLQVENRVVSDVDLPQRTDSFAQPPGNKRRKEGKLPMPKRRKTTSDVPETAKYTKRKPGRLSGGSNREEWDRTMVRSSPPREVQSQYTRAQHGERNFQSQLGSISQTLQYQNCEITAKMERETTGYVPTANQAIEPREQGSYESAGWNKAESRISELEDRLSSLEKRLIQDSDWARSIGTFLYDANEKTLMTFRELFGAVTALKDVMEAALGETGRLG